MVKSTFILFLVVSNFIFSQVDIQQKVKAFVAYPGFENASISFQAIDCATGIEIVSINPSTSLSPASTMKLFSTATAIEVLGPNYRPSTFLYYEGEIKDSILHGNIWIVGGGDMAVGSKYFSEGTDKTRFLNDWTASIKSVGIKEIKGSVIGDASKFGYEGVPDGWNWSDMGNYYGAGFSGLSIYDNQLEYHFSTGASGSTSTLTRTVPFVQNLNFLNYISSAAVSDDNSYIYGAPFSMERFGTGKLPQNKNDFMVKGSLPDPEMQTAYELFIYLKENGISVQGGSKCRRLYLAPLKTELTLIQEFKGKTVLELATPTNHKSINMFAEGLLCNVGFKQTGDGSTNASTEYAEKYWSKRIKTTGLYIKDGSGLARTNAASASHFCAFLKSMYESVNYKYFLSTLPVAGVSGTLSSVCKNEAAHGKMKAKSGTMSRVKSYAGYIESSSGKTIAFSIIVNNYNCSNSATVQEMEKIFNALSSL